MLWASKVAIVHSVAEMNILDSAEQELQYCGYCPKMCRHSCPVAEVSGNESHTPGAKMDALYQLVLGNREWNEETTSTMWACTGCKHCTIYCKHESEPGVRLIAARHEANARGVTHPALQDYPERFSSRQKRLLKKVQEDLQKWAEKKSPVAFLPGCDALSKSPEKVAETMQLLNSYGDVRLAKVTCLGYPLVASGNKNDFSKHSNEAITELQDTKILIVNCSACLHTAKEWYPPQNSFAIVSLSEWLLKAKTKPVKDDDIVYYHDPCYLARYEGEIDAPRNVLNRYAEVREFSWNKEDSQCCGGAGLVPKTMPETANGMAKQRLQEIASLGGGTVVTACSTCSFMLRSNAPEGVTVHNLSDYVAEKERKDPTPEGKAI